MSGVPDIQEPADGIDTGTPHSARVWNYWLGGKDNYEVDRRLGATMEELYPQIIDIARASRRFQARAVRYLAEDVGIRQFLDLGTSACSPEPCDNRWERTSGRDWATLAAAVDGDSVKHPAGRRMHYSNPGTALLGLIVERVRGRHWFDVLQDEVLAPLGMGRTTHDPQPPHAQGYAVHP